MKKEEIKFGKDKLIFCNYDELDKRSVNDLKSLSAIACLEVVLRLFFRESIKDTDIQYLLIDIYHSMIVNPNDTERIFFEKLKTFFSTTHLKSSGLFPIDLSKKIKSLKDMGIYSLVILEIKIRIPIDGEPKVYTWYTISYNGNLTKTMYNKIASPSNTVDPRLKDLNLWDNTKSLEFLYRNALIIKKACLLSLIPIKI